MADRQKLKEKYGDEQVLVVPLDIVRALGLDKDEYVAKPHGEMMKDLAVLEKSAYFIPRYESDDNPNEVEIIGYVVFRDLCNYFTYKRIKNGDARGNGKLSIGIGGHINPCDEADELGAIMASTYREIEEELGETDDYDLPVLVPKAFIRCKATPFDLDHLGIHFELEQYSNVYAVEEEDKMLPVGMVNINALTQLYYDELENWTKIIVDNCGGVEEYESE